MKSRAILLCLLSFFQTLHCQEWVVEIEELRNGRLEDLISVDGGESVLGIGHTNEIGFTDGIIVKVGKDGNSMGRVVHLPGMMLQYHSAVQLGSGDYMLFGICDDSLCDPNSQRFLRVDILNERLETLSTTMYSVDDELFDCFYYSYLGQIMKSIVSRSGSVILATRPSYYNSGKGYYDCAIRFYEFEATGEIIRIVDNSQNECYLSAIKEITYAPHSDNLMVFVNGGWFGNAGGVSGIFLADTSFQIIAHQSLYQLEGANYDVDDNACEGKWIDDGRLIVDLTKRLRSGITYHKLYCVDSALNIHASLRLPPYDSCTWSPEGTSTAYINDSTIFAFTYCSEFLLSSDMKQANVILVDKHLNLLGRKVMRKEGVKYYCSSPAAFNDGGCVVPVYSRNGDNYPGDPFYKVQLMKFRREDIEITWDVVQENEPQPTVSAYPNPTRGNVNIPIGEAALRDARLQIFDMKGRKCLDCSLNGQGNLVFLDVQNLEAGTYIYRIISSINKIVAGKFIKD